MFKTLYNSLDDKSKLLENESDIINKQIELLKKQKLMSNYEKKNNKNGSLFNYFKETPTTNEINEININKPVRMGENNSNAKPRTFMESVRLFFRTDFYFFMKYYLYFIILFSLCFYILIFLENHAKNGLVITENKVFFYISILC
jgi:hypothetical protein